MLIVLCCFIAAVFLFCCVIWFANWHDSKMANGLKIKFNQFLTMYRIDPNHWTLDRDGTILYEKYYTDERNDIHQWFYFSPIGYLRYKHFYRKKDKKKKKLKSDNRWEKVITSWQEDINKYKEKYTKELQDKIKEI